jgi:hypothetical protein
MELWELVARERIRDTLAHYNWSGDAFRLDELAATFCDDGVLEVRGQEPSRGRTAIIEFLGGEAGPGSDDERRAARKTAAAASGVRRIVRHVVTTTRFLEVAHDQARVESYFTVFSEIGLDHFGRYRDTLVPLGDSWLLRHRLAATDWRAEGSTMAPGVTASADDRLAIADLVLEYGARLDAGDLEGVVELFAHSTYRTHGSPVVLRGSDEVLAAQRYVMRLYDGSPCTHHNITNIRVELDESGERAMARSYYTVIFAEPGTQPAVILTGRYEDTFEKVAGMWRFSDRLTYLDQIGDLSRHLRLDRMDADWLT